MVYHKINFCMSKDFPVLQSGVARLARSLFHSYKSTKIFAPFFPEIPNAFPSLQHLDLGVRDP